MSVARAQSLPASLVRIKGLVPFAPLIVATIFLAQRSISGVLAKLGHPGAALDDAYIHFQYARAFAEGHPFRFQAGEPISTGATSFLWPIVLAPFYALGFRGESIMWPAWLLSYLALGALAWEAYLLARPLTGRAAAIGAGAMVLAFGGFAWCAGSGMEVVPFAWLIASAIRRAADWAEDPSLRTPKNLRILIVLAVLCPLMRPEGAISSIALGVIVAVFPRSGPPRRRRLEAAAFIGAAVLPNLILLILTGSATSSTAQVKLLPGNPYFGLEETVLANARLLVGTILDGQVWSAEFLPKGGAIVACFGLVATSWRAHATRKYVRGALVLMLALSMFVPCFYVTFLWNRLRYLWPFATGWILGLACLARTVASGAALIDRRAGAMTSALVAGAFAGMFAVRLEWVLDDVAQSASGIDRQQATLGRWAATNLPADARIGVNDTGAIAYFSGKKTFDVVGLTTPTEGKYWVAGQGSRFEHYERMPRGSLPTHFIVYPEWMACEPLIGRPLTEATVTDSTILGGQTMRASEARWDHLGSGDRPWTPHASIADTLDVADLESEATHRYALEGARDGEQTVTEETSPSSSSDIVIDGARTNRVRERFQIKLAEHLIARVDPSSSTTLHLRIDGREAGSVSLVAGPWQEADFEIPSDRRGTMQSVELVSEVPFASYHYWSVSR